MTWQEFKAEVDRQIQAKSIPEDAELLYVDTYPGDGVDVKKDHGGTFYIQ